MNELRWILLAAGLLLILGIYLWGLRSRRKAAGPATERHARVEPARIVTVAPELEPVPESERAGIATEEPPAEADGPVVPAAVDEEAYGGPRRVAGAVRREPRFEPLPEFTIEQRAEPTIGAPAMEPAAIEEPAAAPQRATARVEPAPEPPR